MDPVRRRRGIGGALFRVVEAQDDRAAVTLQSNLPDAWVQGRRFLERRGFREARRHLEMERRGPAPDADEGGTGWTIRPYAGTSEDVASWRGLNAAGFATDPDVQDLTEEDAGLLAGAPGFALWLGEDVEGPLGLCHVREVAGGGRIESLVVSPEKRRRGVGRSLVTTALRDLERRGVERVELGVAASNEPAVRLYRALGFQVVDGMTTWRRSRGGAPAGRP